MENIEEKRKKLAVKLAWILIPLLVIVLIANLIKDSKDENETDTINKEYVEPQYKIVEGGDIKVLVENYRKNGPAFLEKYKGCKIEFIAEVIDVSEFGLSYIVHVDDDASYQVGTACYFASEEKNSIIKLEKGSSIRMQGRPIQADFGKYLEFTDCKIVDLIGDSVTP